MFAYPARHMCILCDVHIEMLRLKTENELHSEKERGKCETFRMDRVSKTDYRTKSSKQRTTDGNENQNVKLNSPLYQFILWQRGHRNSARILWNPTEFWVVWLYKINRFSRNSAIFFMFILKLSSFRYMRLFSVRLFVRFLISFKLYAPIDFKPCCQLQLLPHFSYRFFRIQDMVI